MIFIDPICFTDFGKPSFCPSAFIPFGSSLPSSIRGFFAGGYSKFLEFLKFVLIIVLIQINLFIQMCLHVLVR
jgi:hypothetical protein